MIAHVTFDMQVPDGVNEILVRHEVGSALTHMGPASQWWNVIDSSVRIDLISDNPGQSPESAKSEFNG